MACPASSCRTLTRLASPPMLFMGIFARAPQPRLSWVARDAFRHCMRCGMNILEGFQSILDRLGNSASVKNVYGEPIVAEGKTIIPVAKVGYGFGGGSGMNKCGTAAKGRRTRALDSAAALGLPRSESSRSPRTTPASSPSANARSSSALILGVIVGVFLGRRR